MSKQNDDLEAGSPLLYPSMQDSPDLRWPFIRKVYSILTIQLLVTFGFVALVIAVQPVATFFKGPAGLAVYIVAFMLAIVVTFLLACFRNIHPLNFVFLGIFTLCFGFIVGMAASFTSAIVVAKAVLATTVVVITLTIYTFWAAKRGQDFSFLVPFLISLLVILFMFGIFQLFYPMGKVSGILYSGVTVILFSAYIIYDTDTLIMRSSYDDYIWASVSLYLDVVGIFLQLLTILGSTNE